MEPQQILRHALLVYKHRGLRYVVRWGEYIVTAYGEPYPDCYVYRGTDLEEAIKVLFGSDYETLKAGIKTYA